MNQTWKGLIVWINLIKLASKIHYSGIIYKINVNLSGRIIPVLSCNLFGEMDQFLSQSFK